jgi:hypothetical protein
MPPHLSVLLRLPMLIYGQASLWADHGMRRRGWPVNKLLTVGYMLTGFVTSTKATACPAGPAGGKRS